LGSKFIQFTVDYSFFLLIDGTNVRVPFNICTCRVVGIITRKDLMGYNIDEKLKNLHTDI
jgi:hypothetical protein